MTTDRDVRFSALNFGDYKTPWMCARQYLVSARPFFIDLPSNVDELNAEIFRQLPAFSFNATNLIFSAELYLKTINHLEHGKFPYTHDLLKLFNLLTADTRSKLTDFFWEIDSNVQRNVAFYSLISKSDDPRRIDPKETIREHTGRESDSNLTLETILLETGDTYKWWRYIFQGTRGNEEFSVVIFHFDRLITFCEAIDRILKATHEKIQDNNEN